MDVKEVFSVKRLIAFLICISTLFWLATPVFAAEAQSLVLQDTSASFLDSEGKLNCLNVIVDNEGVVNVTHYLEGALLNTARVHMVSGDKFNISVTDARTGAIQTSIESLSTYFTVMETPTIRVSGRSSYTNYAHVNFYQHQPGPGIYVTHSHELDFYKQCREITEEYRDFNAGVGTTVSAAVGMLATVLALYWNPLASIASNLFVALANSVGATIIGGVCQSLISARYLVEVERYNIKVIDPDSSETKYYSAERYRTYVPNQGYSSEYFESNYLQVTPVCADVYSDFWPECDYLGVSSSTIF